MLYLQIINLTKYKILGEAENMGLAINRRMGGTSIKIKDILHISFLQEVFIKILICLSESTNCKIRQKVTLINIYPNYKMADILKFP